MKEIKFRSWSGLWTINGPAFRKYKQNNFSLFFLRHLSRVIFYFENNWLNLGFKYTWHVTSNVTLSTLPMSKVVNEFYRKVLEQKRWYKTVQECKNQKNSIPHSVHVLLIVFEINWNSLLNIAYISINTCSLHFLMKLVA